MAGGDFEIKLPKLLTDDVVTVVAGPLREAARSPHFRTLTLDAAETTDLSARGLGLLVALTRIARSRGGHVFIVNADESLHPLLEAAHLDQRPSIRLVDRQTWRGSA